MLRIIVALFQQITDFYNFNRSFDMVRQIVTIKTPDFKTITEMVLPGTMVTIRDYWHSEEQESRDVCICVCFDQPNTF